MSCSRIISPRPRPARCCRLAGRATSPSSWSSGRATPTAPSTTRATASLKLVPGINGPTSLAAIRNADDDLGRMLRGAARARPRRDDRHHRHRRSRLLDDLEGERAPAPRRKQRLCRRAAGLLAAGLCRPRSRQGAGSAAIRSRRRQQARSSRGSIRKSATG